MIGLLDRLPVVPRAIGATCERLIPAEQERRAGCEPAEWPSACLAGELRYRNRMLRDGLGELQDRRLVLKPGEHSAIQCCNPRGSVPASARPRRLFLFRPALARIFAVALQRNASATAEADDGAARHRISRLTKGGGDLARALVEPRIITDHLDGRVRPCLSGEAHGRSSPCPLRCRTRAAAKNAQRVIKRGNGLARQPRRRCLKTAANDLEAAHGACEFRGVGSGAQLLHLLRLDPRALVAIPNVFHPGIREARPAGGATDGGLDRIPRRTGLGALPREHLRPHILRSLFGVFKSGNAYS